MRRIKGRDTGPEMRVRRLIHRMGYRYRLHSKQLPGTPDIVFPSRRKVIMIHGCFWHQHPGCRLARTPKARPEYWLPKLARNQARDQRNLDDLRALGWDALVIWECQTKNEESLRKVVSDFLNRPAPEATSLHAARDPRQDARRDPQ